MRLTYTEDNSVTAFEFIIDMQVVVEGPADVEGRLPMRATVGRVRAGGGNAGVGIIHFDSQAPDPRHPLRAFAELPGRGCTFRLDPRTGGVSGLSGMQEAVRAIEPGITQAMFGFPASWVRAYVARTLEDEHIEQIFDSLLHVRPGGSPRVSWGGRQGSYFLDRPKAKWVIAAANLPKRLRPAEPYRLTGSARFAGGRLLKSSLEQELIYAGEIKGPVDGKVSLLRASLEILPSGE
jgi:hypothetical protein